MAMHVWMPVDNDGNTVEHEVHEREEQERLGNCGAAAKTSLPALHFVISGWIFANWLKVTLQRRTSTATHRDDVSLTLRAGDCSR